LVGHTVRWAFLTLGALTASSVLFVYLYSVNEEVYDPSLFAIGVGGLFAASCGAILLLVNSNRKFRAELRRSLTRCELLADRNWELQEAEQRARSLFESQGDLIVLRDAFHGRTYGALSATPSESKQAPFAPLVPGFVVVPKDPAALDAAVDAGTAAVLLEPIQGESGINPCTTEFLTGLRRRTSEPDCAHLRVYGPEPHALLGSAHITAGELIADRLLSPAEVQGLLN